jgi:carbonic anhydrase
MKITLPKWALLISGLLTSALLLLAAGCQSSNQQGATYSQLSAPADAGMYPPARTKESQEAMELKEAVELLKAGNARFVAGRTQERNLPAKVKATASGQYPFAVILSCLDSRMPMEIIFDQGIGDVFHARVAGNVLTDEILGSMEFACRVAGAKLIVVIGHSNCGAVKGAIDDVQLGSLTGLLARIKPAAAQVPDNGKGRNSKNDDYVQKVAEANVRVAMQQIRERSPVLKEMLDSGKIGLVGGMYDLATGRVEFFP